MAQILYVQDILYTLYSRKVLWLEDHHLNKLLFKMT